MSVPANIRKYRLQREWTQAELAARVGKRRVTITRYELGSVDLPVSVLQAIARALQVPVHQLLESHGEDDGAQPSER
jgi:transcriptional regulator with XRE-family HTH domain